MHNSGRFHFLWYGLVWALVLFMLLYPLLFNTQSSKPFDLAGGLLQPIQPIPPMPEPVPDFTQYQLVVEKKRHFSLTYSLRFKIKMQR
jgi:hypothetical protein